MKTVIILKGVSSSGKTSFAQLFPNSIICSADDFFHDEYGNYNWVAEKLPHAHAACRDKFDAALLDESIENIVISNVNSKPRDWSYYDTTAKKLGLRVYHVVIERRHDNKNDHALPDFVYERQAREIEENLKLL